MAIGGSGGDGGNGGAVQVKQSGTLSTTEVMSPGVAAASIGGGGGQGGGAIALSVQLGSPSTISTAIGGSGGSGGTGGVVGINCGSANSVSFSACTGVTAVSAATASSAINTLGDASAGILGLSVGGGGGTGGSSVALAAGVVSTQTYSVGGSGTNGGAGGDIYAGATGFPITTSGAHSAGIEVLSVGGGGGHGGVSASGSTAGLTTVSTSVGGKGGAGGNSGSVSVTNQGLLQVIGRGGAGILGLSVGGGGGNGGSSVSADISLISAFTSSVGGTGGGGISGSVNVTNSGKIYTGYDAVLNPSKDMARGTQGILAMSIGGGGGRGGMAVAGSVGGSVANNYGLTDAVGGGAGAGGTSGTVTVTNNAGGIINSFGDLSNAITAVSIGGRGGMGGMAIAGNISLGNVLNESLGSNGGAGGNGSTAQVTNSGAIASYGFRSMGIVAQSMGGHGGMGGMAIGATVASNLSSTTVSSQPTTAITLGGTGGAGGIGGSATISHSGASVLTVGPFSTGLFAQSIGGDGGIGGMGISAASDPFSVNTTLGGNGGSGALGGAATVTASGPVNTSGSQSNGVMAQSIGGNGGMSGLSIGLVQAGAASTHNMTLGNAGGSGGTGGTATASVSSPIVTSGNLSDGVAVQSVGGGGGRSTLDLNLSVANSATPDSNGSARLGATGGGGNGGLANLTQTGTVNTSGWQSSALSATSIGGGGGSAAQRYGNISSGSKTMDFKAGGGSTAVGGGGNGGAVTVSANLGLTAGTDAAGKPTNTLQTTSLFSDAVFAESIGGGGGQISGVHQQTLGSGTFAAKLGLGGTAGTGGNGGAVTVNTGGAIKTQGFISNAVVAQSVGGGGGQVRSGFSGNSSTSISIPGTNIQLVAGSGTATTPTAAPVPDSSTTVSVRSAAAMALGGTSTLVGNGGTVNVTSTSVISTSGWGSDAISAQSVGDGGGRSQQFDFWSNSPFAAGTMTLGGGGIGGGSGSFVTVANNGPINTFGNLSTGIFAQSLGGGGGDAQHWSYTALKGLTVGYTMNLGQLSGAANNNIGETVNVTNSAAINTWGAGADGIMGQSIGGGGGKAAFAAGGGLASVITPTSTSGTASAQAGLLPASVSSVANSAASGLSSGHLLGSQVSNSNGVSYAGVLGANGGTGLEGHHVFITNTASVQTGVVPNSTTATSGYGSSAIIAQSIGAGGGVLREHGTNVDLTQTSVALTLGATSSQGDGDGVDISNNTAGTLSTAANAATALLAQSVGGGGGVAILTNTTVGMGGSLAVGVVMGNPLLGDSSSGFGYNVSVGTGGTITTAGDSAGGILAQSIGGGGGVAKVSTAATTAGASLLGTPSVGANTALTNTGLAVAATLGSSTYSLSGSMGQSVLINNGSMITTQGSQSPGIIAQSIGEGGGVLDVHSVALNSGAVGLNLQLGALGADGIVTGYPNQINGTVTLDSQGGITTHGDRSEGILAQSIDGGGGRIGIVTKSASTVGSGAGTIILGGRGLSSLLYSSGSRAGNITGSDSTKGMTVDGAVTTFGAGSTAVIGQSIGGGGGEVSLGLSNTTASYDVILGNQNSWAITGNNGGTVLATPSGALTTSGSLAYGLLMQSIGGGGGRFSGPLGTATLGSSKVNSTYGGGFGGNVSLRSTSPINTSGIWSHAIVAQSIGGGGGIVDGIPATSLVLGGKLSGYGGAVSVTGNGAGIRTTGENAVGILAQSVGGGGRHQLFQQGEFPW